MFYYSVMMWNITCSRSYRLFTIGTKVTRFQCQRGFCYFCCFFGLEGLPGVSGRRTFLPFVSSVTTDFFSSGRRFLSLRLVLVQLALLRQVLIQLVLC
jgi:hypothetical protein